MLLAFAGLFLTGSPSAAEESPTAAKQPTAPGGHLLVYPNAAWAKYPSLQEAIRAGDQVGVSVVVFYERPNYDSSGATLTYSVFRDCTATLSDKDFKFPNFPNGWSNQASSVTTQLGNGSHCDVWMSDLEGFLGECGNKWIDLHWDLRQVPYGCDNKASSFELS
ncbi:hypothetical protein ACIBBB_25100 [Streptomyces sp. NPDC051217]|uniref:hypothetical protein n=1 Tax=Streptomyces sp. NPDC051217 TaxID=3365644 RepID=UPI00379EAA0D